MSGRKNFVKFQNITSGDMSTSSITSAVSNIQHLDNIGIQLNWSGSPVGSFAIQVSADYAQDTLGNVTNTGNWTPLSFSTAPTTASGSPIYLDIAGLSAPWIRVVYTKISGTGTLQSYLIGKML